MIWYVKKYRKCKLKLGDRRGKWFLQCDAIIWIQSVWKQLDCLHFASFHLFVCCFFFNLVCVAEWVRFSTAVSVYVILFCGQCLCVCLCVVLFVTGFELCNSVYRMTSIKINITVDYRLFSCCTFLQAVTERKLHNCVMEYIFFNFRSFHRHTGFLFFHLYEYFFFFFKKRT